LLPILNCILRKRNMLRTASRSALPLLSICALLCGGCPAGVDVLAQIEANLNRTVDVIQTEDPRTAVLPTDLTDRGDTVFIDADVVVVTNVRTDLVVDTLPDVNLLGFENLTGDDIYLRYYAEDALQGVFVFDGETLLLEYPCLSDFELISENHFDPATGIFLESFDLAGGLFVNPDDYECGDAVILTFDVLGISADVQLFAL
jgi:hypothetical protein